MFYRAQRGESPAMIARKHGVPVIALMRANPHKPTTVVSGKHTWQNVGIGEQLRLPEGAVGFVGDAAADAVNAVISAGGPCLQKNASLVCAAQRALGVLADGEWGNGTATAARAHVSSAPGGCSPTPMWWGAKGTNHCGGASAAPSSGGSAPVASSGVTNAARAALTALSGDPSYCTSVKRTGTAVNTAVHNFKSAWNAANPSRAVPINTGNYEVSVAAALWSALGGTVDVPPGCGAAGTPGPASSGPPPGPPPPPPSVTPVASSGAPGAVQALTSINPCAESSSGTVYAAQVALGIKPDGKYGVGTASAARALGVNAPAGCSPAPMWWGAKGTPQAAAAVSKAAAAAPAAGTMGPGVTQVDQAKAASAAAAAQAADAVAKSAAADTKTQADAAAATAQAAIDAAAKAAASATTPAQKDAAAAAGSVAQTALDTAEKKGGTAPGGTGITPPTEKKGLSTGAIVAGAVGVAALVGLLAAAAMSKKTGHRGARGARGPSRRKSSHKSKRKSSKRKKR